MSELNLLPTETEDDLRDVVRQLLTRRCPPSAVVAMYDGDRSIVDGLWSALAVDLGLGGLLISEANGGAGASAREAAVVLEELGRAVAPVPFLTSSVLAVAVLNEAEHVALLRKLAAGERTAALIVPWSTGPAARIPTVDVDASGAISGTITSVAGAIDADLLLVPVLSDGTVTVHAVSAHAAQIEPITSLDMSRQIAHVTFDRAAGEVVLHDAEPAIRRALTLTAALLASEQVGLAQQCLQTTVDYLGQRRQFGRAVGSFQAVKHRLADLFSGVEVASAAAAYAAATISVDDGGGDREVAAGVAQAYCSDLAVLAAEEAVQLHAGIGMTWEHPAHLYLKRAKSDQLALGTSGAHGAFLATLVDLPAG